MIFCNKIVKRIVACDDPSYISHGCGVLVVFCKPILAILLQRKHQIACCYLLYHLANFMLPKRRFWKVKQTVWRAFSKHFLTFASPNPVLTPLKVLRKRILKCWFGLPTSSFGPGELVTKDHSIPETPTHHII